MITEPMNCTLPVATRKNRNVIHACECGRFYKQSAHKGRVFWKYDWVQCDRDGDWLQVALDTPAKV